MTVALVPAAGSQRAVNCNILRRLSSQHRSSGAETGIETGQAIVAGARDGRRPAFQDWRRLCCCRWTAHTKARGLRMVQYR
jgi:hypothetical protein